MKSSPAWGIPALPADPGPGQIPKKDVFHQFWNIQGEITIEFEGYCVKCRKKQMLKNSTLIETSNGRRMAQGTCPVCKTKVTGFLPKGKTG